jgi:hypothetical protein
VMLLGDVAIARALSHTVVTALFCLLVFFYLFG